MRQAGGYAPLSGGDSCREARGKLTAVSCLTFQDQQFEENPAEWPGNRNNFKNIKFTVAMRWERLSHS
ncbi:hypothetical protein CapIbe_018463 [Capra ibex]